jgi:hypothetical protein
VRTDPGGYIILFHFVCLSVLSVAEFRIALKTTPFAFDQNHITPPILPAAPITKKATTELP